MITRRGLTASAAALAFSGLAGNSKASTACEARQLALDCLAKSREATLTLGEAYLRSHPDERNVDHLARTLRSALADIPYGHPRDRMRERVHSDFASSRTAVVDGWVLSQSEARLFALGALL